MQNVDVSHNSGVREEISSEQIEQKVLDVVRNILENKNVKLNCDSLLMNDLAIDSMAMVMLMNDLEDEFKICIEDDELDGVSSVRDVLNFVEKRHKETRKEELLHPAKILEKDQRSGFVTGNRILKNNVQDFQLQMMTMGVSANKNSLNRKNKGEDDDLDDPIETQSKERNPLEEDDDREDRANDAELMDDEMEEEQEEDKE